MYHLVDGYLVWDTLLKAIECVLVFNTDDTSASEEFPMHNSGVLFTWRCQWLHTVGNYYKKST